MAKKIVVMAAVLLSLTSGAKAECYSEGIRAGVIQKFSDKGLINKSWEGEMVQEGLRSKSNPNGGSSLTNVWKFSVIDRNVANKVNDAMFKGGEVRVKYCQALIRNPLTSNTSYIVTDVAGN